MRELRPDVRFDELIRAIYPNLEAFEAKQAESVSKITARVTQKSLGEIYEEGMKRQQKERTQRATTKKPEVTDDNTSAPALTSREPSVLREVQVDSVALSAEPLATPRTNERKRKREEDDRREEEDERKQKESNTPKLSPRCSSPFFNQRPCPAEKVLVEKVEGLLEPPPFDIEFKWIQWFRDPDIAPKEFTLRTSNQATVGHLIPAVLNSQAVTSVQRPDDTWDDMIVTIVRGGVSRWKHIPLQKEWSIGEIKNKVGKRGFMRTVESTLRF
ncbi:hypothetical protein HK104_006319 [Borealophlyctis nickersoniae]|nr:hypothetical protein HK104_006319 [Borealophlyctis nickersoniae]